MNNPNKHMDTQFLECIQEVSKQLDERQQLEALLAVLNQFEDRIGLITDIATFSTTKKVINEKIRSIS